MAGLGRMTKIEIARFPAKGQRAYEHLLPIVEVLIQHGNRLAMGPDWVANTYGYRFRMNAKDGWVCVLENPIDVELIRSSFILPSSIIVAEDGRSIFDRDSWIEIQGGMAPVPVAPQGSPG